MTELTVLITGATDGLGRAVAKALAAEGATLLLHGRSFEKLAATKSEIETTTGNTNVTTFLADFAELDQVRKLAADVIASTDRLDVLLDNAGIGSGLPDLTTRQTSADGYELRFAVNYLAGFLLTQELLPLLIASAPSRIVLVSSIGQAPIDFEDVMLERHYSGRQAYAQSKLAQINYGFELASRLEGTGVTVNSFHPGTYMPTKIVVSGATHSVDSLETGVDSALWMIESPDLDGVTGHFYDRKQETWVELQAHGADPRARLWNLSRNLTNAPDVPTL
ncbi:MAG: short-chain dehydrogenase/reductase [Actinomycetia bacterium]|nr:short-chain dehydrogenase/reductase [Actinomycetes bacterium]